LATIGLKPDSPESVDFDGVASHFIRGNCVLIPNNMQHEKQTQHVLIGIKQVMSSGINVKHFLLLSKG